MLRTIQNFARKLGFRILQRTIIKYTVPVASAVVGSTYNYVTTSSMGRIAKAHFRNRGNFTGELQTLVSRQNTCDLVFPAAAMYMSCLDGELSPKERDLYRAMLSRMTFSEHTEAEFRRLVDDEANLVEAAAGIEDMELRRSLMDVLVLMAVCDGELAEKESEFLMNIAGRLDVPLDLGEVEQRTKDYRVIVKQSIAGRATTSVRDTATLAGDKARRKARRTFGKILKRRTVPCSGCGAEVFAAYRFCPECGQSVVSERDGVS